VGKHVADFFSLKEARQIPDGHEDTVIDPSASPAGIVAESVSI
jgi:hypothetical protein